MLVAGDAPTVPASLRVRVSLGFAAQGAATATTATAAAAAAAAAAASQWEGARVIVRLVPPAAGRLPRHVGVGGGGGDGGGGGGGGGSGGVNEQCRKVPSTLNSFY